MKSNILLADTSLLTQSQMGLLNGEKGDVPSLSDWDDSKNIDSNGVMYIPITGALWKKNAPISVSGWLTTYSFLHDRIQHAYNNDNVKSVVFNVDSPGGHAMNCRAISDEIALLSQKKDCKAVVNGMCCSAAFMLVARIPIYATEGSTIGSIGVIGAMIDDSKLYEKYGITIHNMSIPDGKIVCGDGVAITPEHINSKMESTIKGLHKDVVSMVAPRVSEDKIMELDAKTFITNDALALGLIDRVITAEELLNNTLYQKGEEDMPEIKDGTVTMSQEELHAMMESAVQKGMDAVIQQQAKAQAELKAKEEAEAQAQQQATDLQTQVNGMVGKALEETFAKMTIGTNGLPTLGQLQGKEQVDGQEDTTAKEKARADLRDYVSAKFKNKGA